MYDHTTIIIAVPYTCINVRIRRTYYVVHIRYTHNKLLDTDTIRCSHNSIRYELDNLVRIFHCVQVVYTGTFLETTS